MRRDFFSFLTVAMSIDAVASSMMRMLLLRTKALARQKSCLWPTLKFSPPSVTTASIEVLKFLDVLLCQSIVYITTRAINRPVINLFIGY